MTSKSGARQRAGARGEHGAVERAGARHGHLARAGDLET